MNKILLSVLTAIFSFPIYASVLPVAELYKNKYYIGGVGGSGSTTWRGLVPAEENRNDAMSISTPILVREGGAVWGLFGGYEISPYFALEANYMHFPSAVITFDEDSLFAFDYNNMTKLVSKTQTGSVIGKVMLIVPNSPFRLYSGAGLATVWRSDEINTEYRLSPTFAFGVTLNVNQRLMFEIGANYTAGYGESEINPVNDFVPFVYAFYGKVALRFNTLGSFGK